MKNICFVSNFSKTILYRAIANELKLEGYKIFWIFVDSAYVHFACDDVFLKIDLSFSKKTSPPVDNFYLNEIIESDRFLRLHKAESYKYLVNIQSVIYNFINGNYIKFIFGERTWGHELLIGRMCKKRIELQCQYYSLSDIRIPSFRFGFFIDERETKLFAFDLKNEETDFEIQKPEYLTINNNILTKKKSLSSKIERLVNFLSGRNIRKYNPTVLHSFSDRFFFGIKDEFNRFAYIKFVKKDNYESLRNSRYIFYGLHKQPESSIDVVGRYNEDQYRNIYNLWRLLPYGWILIVKEHNSGIGDRSYLFYCKIRKLPGVFLVHEDTDSHEIIRNAKITVTVSGTIALEAGLMKKNAITLSKVFFNFLANVKNVTVEELSNIDIENIKFEENVSLYKEYILKNTFAGNVSDPVTFPSILDKENIEKLIGAIKLLIQRSAAM